MKRINFEDGQLVNAGYVKEDGTIEEAVYEGSTPLSAFNMNKLQDNIEEDINALKSTATTTKNGLMSSTDKAKLNGIATGANKTTVVNNLTSTSTTSALSANMGKTLAEKIETIIESGANSNGYYIKYVDGTMLQTGNVSITANTPRNQGGLTYFSGAEIIDFPQNFINNNYQAFTNVLMANMNYFAQSYSANVSKSQTTISFISTGNGETRTIQWIAIGRWK